MKKAFQWMGFLSGRVARPSEKTVVQTLESLLETGRAPFELAARKNRQKAMRRLQPRESRYRFSLVGS